MIGLVLIALATGIIVDLFENKLDAIEHKLEDQLHQRNGTAGEQGRIGFDKLMLELGMVEGRGGKPMHAQIEHRSEFHKKRQHRHRLRDEGAAGATGAAGGLGARPLPPEEVEAAVEATARLSVGPRL